MGDMMEKLVPQRVIGSIIVLNSLSRTEEGYSALKPECMNLKPKFLFYAML